jgi:hypothetical protein
MLKKLASLICGIGVITLVPLTSIAIAKDATDTKLDAKLSTLNKKIESAVEGLKSKNENLDFTIFGRKDGGYVRLYTTLQGMQNTELESHISHALHKNKMFKGNHTKVGKFQCEQTVYKSMRGGNYVLFVGKNCR